MTCENCGANLAVGTVGIDPATFINARRERWPEVEWFIYEQRKRRCEETAQMILDARALYPDKSLAWLYDEAAMPPELRAAHEANDRAVMDMYGFSYDMTEEEIVGKLICVHVSGDENAFGHCFETKIEIYVRARFDRDQIETDTVRGLNCSLDGTHRPWTTTELDRVQQKSRIT